MGLSSWKAMRSPSGSKYGLAKTKYSSSVVACAEMMRRPVRLAFQTWEIKGGSGLRKVR